MSWVTVGIVGASLIGGVASNMAADKQAEGGERGLAQQRESSMLARQDLMPWANSGGQANAALVKQMGLGANGQVDPNSPLMKPFGLADFHESPAYQFNLAEGTKAIDKAANARGNLYAPQTLQDISKFSQGTASNEFNNAYNMYNQNQGNQFSRLFGMSGAGQNAAAGQGGFAMSAGNNMAQTQMGIGNVQASGIMGANNAIQGGIGQAYNQYLMNQIMKQNNGSLYGSQPTPTQSGFGAP